jgi:hypothetical protein
MSTLNVSNITDGTDTVGTSYVVNGSAKAWARYDGFTPALNESFNVSSLTDDATGDQTLTFVNSMSSTNFAFAGHSSQFHTGNDNVASSSTINIFTANTSHVKTDTSRVGCTVFGDLA